MRKFLLLLFTVLLMVSVGCKKTPKNDAQVKPAVDKKYAKYRIAVYKTPELKKWLATLAKAESVDLLNVEDINIKGKTVKVAKIKLSDDTEGFIKLTYLADAPVVFLQETKGFSRNNKLSSVKFTIPIGTLGFTVDEKGNWIKVFLGKLNGKWIGDCWVKEGYSSDENIILNAQEYEKSLTTLNKKDAKEDAKKDAIKKLEELQTGGTVFSDLAQSFLEKYKKENNEDENKEENAVADNFLKVISEGGLRMRENADLTSEKIATIPNGTKVEKLEETGDVVTISGKTGKWTKVKWEDKEGWVFGGFLSK